MADLPTQETPPSRFPHIPWLDAQYFENQRNFSQDELLKFAGKHIAFSWQGDRILASGDTEDEVCRKLLASGLDPQRVVFSYVDNP